MGEGDEGEWELALERISDTDDTAFGYLWAARDGLLDGTYTVSAGARCKCIAGRSRNVIAPVDKPTTLSAA